MKIAVFLLLLSLPLAAWGENPYATKTKAEQWLEQTIALEQSAEGEEHHAQIRIWKEVAQNYQNILKENPRLFQAYWRLGYVLYLLGEHQKAIKILEQGLNLRPHQIDMMHYLGLNLYALGKYQKSEALLQKVFEADDTRPDVSFILGKLALKHKDWSQAIRYFEQTQSLMPEHEEVYGHLAWAYFKNRQYSKAQNSLQHWSSLSPKSPEPWVQLGHLSFAQKDLASAAQYYREALERSPQRWDIAYHLASVHYRQGHWKVAENFFKQVLAREPHHLGALYFLAETQMQLGNLTRARALFQQFLDKYSKHAPTYRRLAEISLREAKLDQALRAIESAVDLAPQDKEIRLLAGDIQRHLGHYREAWIHDQVALGLDREHSFRPSLAMAQDLMHLQRFDEAIVLLKNFREEKRAQKPLVLALLYQSRSAIQKGQWDEARILLNQARALPFYQLDVLVASAYLALKMNRLDEAELFLDKARQINAYSNKVRRLAIALDIQKQAWDKAQGKLRALKKHSTWIDEDWLHMTQIYAVRAQWTQAERAFSHLSHHPQYSKVLLSIQINGAIAALASQNSKAFGRWMKNLQGVSEKIPKPLWLALKGFWEIAQGREAYSSWKALYQSADFDFVEKLSWLKMWVRYLIHLQKVDEAFEVLEAHPELWSHLEVKIQAYLKHWQGIQRLSRGKKGLLWLEEARRLGEEGWLIRHHLALARFLKQGDAQAFLEQLNTLILEEPHAELIFHKAVILDFWSLKPKAAFETYEHYLQTNDPRRRAWVNQELTRKKEVFGF